MVVLAQVRKRSWGPKFQSLPSSRDGVRDGVAANFAGVLGGEEEEILLLVGVVDLGNPNRTANGKAVVVITEFAGRSEKGVAGVELVVTEEFEERAVEVLPPDLVTTLMIAPVASRIPGCKLLRRILNSSMASTEGFTRKLPLLPLSSSKVPSTKYRLELELISVDGHAGVIDADAPIVRGNTGHKVHGAVESR